MNWDMLHTTKHSLNYRLGVSLVGLFEKVFFDKSGVFKKYIMKKCFFKSWGSVWYVCLKIENCCLKTFVEIHVGEKIYWIRKMLFKNWKWLFENTNQTPPECLVKTVKKYFLKKLSIWLEFIKVVIWVINYQKG